MAILGAHKSIGGGLDKAVQRAAQSGCDCLQLFTKNCSQWRSRPVTRQQAEQFQKALRQSGMRHPLAHDSYLINLASPDRTLWQRSIHAFVEELRRAQTLGIPYVVTHPGAYTTGNEASGINRIVKALDEIHHRAQAIRVKCLLETTAGQGTSLGWRFEHLAQILASVKEPERLGVCFDTCHVFAAGYPLTGGDAFYATLDQFDKTIGLCRIKAFHLNDSHRECGSRVDRHAHIGRGRIGLDAFRLLLCEPRFQEVPMYLETPKGIEDGVDLDEVNLRVLRGLAKGAALASCGQVDPIPNHR